MNTALLKRLERVEQALKPRRPFVLISEWAHDPEAVRTDKLARWRAGEDIEGAPTDVVDRENADVALIVCVSP